MLEILDQVLEHEDQGDGGQDGDPDRSHGYKSCNKNKPVVVFSLSPARRDPQDKSICGSYQLTLLMLRLPVAVVVTVVVVVIATVVVAVFFTVVVVDDVDVVDVTATNQK